VHRLYQWLQERATFFRTRPRVSEPRRTIRTQVTVEEHQRTVLLNLSPVDGMCLCPLCGHPVAPLPGDTAGPITLDHSQVHARCPGPEEVVVEQVPRLGRPRNTRRLR
jgi:hypothetical protein